MSDTESPDRKILGDIDIWLGRLKPRWMDLVGDYAGEEFFVVDGDSLCQKVLEDELVAIGRDEPSFQILHGIYCLEQAILDLKKRECNFEITFFESNKHGTILTGSDPFVSSSRLLAREIMKAHVNKLTVDGKIGSASFEDLDDPAWHTYVEEKRPMFVLYHIGPNLDTLKGNDAYETARIIIQRDFVVALLASRLAVATLNQIEYIDSKILAFIYERQRASDARFGVPKDWPRAIVHSEDICNEKLEENSLTLDIAESRSPETHEEWLLHATKNMLGTSSSTLDQALALLFVGAQLSLSSLSLSQRAQYPCRVDPKLTKYLLSDFCPRIFQHLARTLGNVTFFPDLDGTLFLVLLNCATGATDHSLESHLGDHLAKKLVELWTSVDLPVPDLAVLSRNYSNVPAQARSSRVQTRFTLLPFSHPIFDKYLPSIGVDEPGLETAEGSTRIERLCDAAFADGRHWHNTKAILPKHLGGREDPTPAATEWEKMKRRRKDQRFMAHIQRHAQTLTGAKGQPIQRIVIAEVSGSAPTGGTSVKRGNDSSSKPPPSSKPTKGSKAKAPQLTSAQKLKAKIEAEKQSKKSSEDDIWWKAQLKEIEAIEGLQGRLSKVELILRGKRAETGWLAVEVPIFRIHLVVLAWIAHEQSESQSVCEEYTVQILRVIHELQGHPSLFPAAANTLAHLLVVLGFESITPPTAKLQDERELSFKFVKLARSKSGKLLHPQLRIKTSPTEFQLQAYGAFMDRSMDSKPDPRVGFDPDGWQREVLDKVDRKESMLVVAPTSAGKTFSSFYAMERVLRESNDGVIVYVSPTKALCQQIAADVYARFSKNMKGRTVWAIHTRDFRTHDPLTTQILVTVPEILSILLLSPSLARAWVPHIKYIILDEIHSIGQLEGGEVWEHIILLSNCPILGLSATIGQPEAFSDWLNSVQKEHNQRYSMIEHKHRYSHLRKYVWKMPGSQQNQAFKGLQSPAPDNSHLRVLHPMSALLLGGHTIPPDLALESQDCLSLFSMMTTCAPPQDLKVLAPDVFFADKQRDLLKQSDIIRYEEALKQTVSQWAQAQGADEPESPYQKLLIALRADMNREGSMEEMEDARPERDAVKNLIQLLHKLDSNRELPCLAFNFDRAGCEAVAEELLNALQEGERVWRKSNPRWTEKIKQWEAWKMAAKARQRDAERASRQKPGEQAETPSASWQSTFDPDDPSPEFSFANTKCGYSKEEFEKDIAPSKWPNNNWADFLVPALQRGIAVHHAGMPKPYRSLVESLFRLGYCRVMISTGTLALGINAPAKSVIFIGDSPFLTALMYRQCAGRAGRRGFDLLGKIIFYNLPLDRVHRLMLSRIPPLTGNWPLTTTLCLRLFNLLTESDHAPSAVTAIDSLMRLPRLSASSDQTRQEVLHHMRFSIEYLRRLRLLSDTGRTTALFGTVGHLYYEEPGNLAFAALVREGIIHQICSTFQTNRSETEKNIVHLVATLFARRPLPYFTASQDVLERLRKTFPSMITLPPLSDHILGALERHNKETLQIFGTYAISYAQQHLAETPESELPLSHHRTNPNAESVGGRLGEALEKTSVKNCTVRSRFVSNSGQDDNFQTIPELCRSSRAGLHLNAKSVPNFDYTAPVNAYALDYWQHESVRPLIEANGLRRGEIWFVLENFAKTLQTLVASLRVLLIDRAATETDVVGPEDDQSEGSGDENDKPEVKVDDEYEEETRGEGDLHEDAEITSRPANVPEEDWIVYEAFQSVNAGFYEKWRKMWA